MAALEIPRHALTEMALHLIIGLSYELSEGSLTLGRFLPSVSGRFGSIAAGHDRPHPTQCSPSRQAEVGQKQHYDVDIQVREGPK